eukprot:298027_1
MIDPESKRYQFKEWWNGPFKTDATKGEPRIIRFHISPDHTFILSCDGYGKVVLQQQYVGSYSANFWNGRENELSQEKTNINLPFQNSDNSPSPSGSSYYEYVYDDDCYFDYGSELIMNQQKRVEMNLDRVKAAQAK